MDSKSNRLDEILGAVLNGITAAQDESNLFSRYLNVKYHQDPILTEFPVPNVVIVGLELDLKFVVEKIVQKELPQEEALLAAKGLFPKYAADITENALAIIDDSLNNKTKTKILSDDEKTILNKTKTKILSDDEKTILEIGENIHTPQFKNYIRQNILADLEKESDNLLDPKDIINVPNAVNTVLRVIMKKLVGHSDISCFLDSKDIHSPEIKKIKKFLGTYFNNELKALTADLEKRVKREIYVLCDIAELGKHSGQEINSIKVSFKLNNQEKYDEEPRNDD